MKQPSFLYSPNTPLSLSCSQVVPSPSKLLSPLKPFWNMACLLSSETCSVSSSLPLSKALPLAKRIPSLQNSLSKTPHVFSFSPSYLSEKPPRYLTFSHSSPLFPSSDSSLKNLTDQHRKALPSPAANLLYYNRNAPPLTVCSFFSNPFTGVNHSMAPSTPLPDSLKANYGVTRGFPQMVTPG